MSQRKPYTKRQVAQYFRNGAKFLETHKWTKGLYFDVDGGSYCAIGACAKGSGLEWSSLGGQPRPTAAPWHGTTEVRAAIDFNDGVAQSKDEVIKYLRRRARELEHGAELKV